MHAGGTQPVYQSADGMQLLHAGLPFSNAGFPFLKTGNGPPRGIGNGPGNRLGPFPVFLENGKSLEISLKTKVFGKVGCPNGSYGP